MGTDARIRLHEQGPGQLRQRGVVPARDLPLQAPGGSVSGYLPPSNQAPAMNNNPPSEQTLEQRLRRACAELEQHVHSGSACAVEVVLAEAPELAGNAEA